MNILVTGSNGFIASSLIDKLLEKGHVIYGLDIVDTPPPRTAYHNSFKPIVADIANEKYIDPNYGAEWWKEIDFCFHLAAMANVDEVREQREKAFQVNLHGTFNIIEACRKYNIPMQFTSTACVYGNTPQHPSTEDGPTFPADWYGVTKRAGEELVKGLLKKYVILRFGTTFGIRMREALCTHIFLTQAMRNEPFSINGSGEQSRNFIYVEDLVDGCCLAMQKLLDGTYENEIFNLVGKESTSIIDVAKIAYEIVNGKKLTDIANNSIFRPWRPEDIMFEDISIKKAYKILGWTPKVTMLEGMKKIYCNWTQHWNGSVSKLQ